MGHSPPIAPTSNQLEWSPSDTISLYSAVRYWFLRRSLVRSRTPIARYLHRRWVGTGTKSDAEPTVGLRISTHKTDKSGKIMKPSIFAKFGTQTDLICAVLFYFGSTKKFRFLLGQIGMQSLTIVQPHHLGQYLEF